MDALCERYQIDNSKRTLHGALMDAELLAEVYLAMTRGQESLLMELDITPLPIDLAVIAENLHLIVLPASEKELELHSQQLENINKQSEGKCLWKHVAFSS